MKVLLRSVETGLYYEEVSKWTPDQTAAFDFEKTTRAVELVFAAHLENVEMLLTSEDPQFDLILPISPKASLTRSIPVPEVVARKSQGAASYEPHHNSSPSLPL